MCLTPSSLNIRDIFLYRGFFSFLTTSTPLLVATSFLKLHSKCDLLPQEKLISRYHVNEFLPDALAKIFYLLISLHLSLTIFIIPFKLQTCCFLYTNANTLLHFLFQFHSPTSHIRFTYPLVIPNIFCRVFYAQTYNPIPVLYNLSYVRTSLSFSNNFHLSKPIGCTIWYPSISCRICYEHT